jgi:hypothetical protein
LGREILSKEGERGEERSGGKYLEYSPPLWY